MQDSRKALKILGKLLNMAKDTKDKILNAGIDMWLENPLSVTANGIASKIGLTHGTVLYNFPNGVRNAVAEHAVKIGNSRIIVQLIALNHESIITLSAIEKSKHLKSV